MTTMQELVMEGNEKADEQRKERMWMEGAQMRKDTFVCIERISMCKSKI